MSLLIAWGWTRWPWKIPSSPNCSMTAAHGEALWWSRRKVWGTRSSWEGLLRTDSKRHLLSPCTLEEINKCGKNEGKWCQSVVLSYFGCAGWFLACFSLLKCILICNKLIFPVKSVLLMALTGKQSPCLFLDPRAFSSSPPALLRRRSEWPSLRAQPLAKVNPPQRQTAKTALCFN